LISALAALLSIASASGPPPGGPAVTGVETAQVTITQSIIIRVPAHRSSRYAPKDVPRPPPAFQEHHGPKCIDAATIGGAAVTAPDSVDFILKGGKRVRARLEEACPALDYYSGFYFRSAADGKLCADRDSIHTRSGGDCGIDKFRTLTPAPPPK
jgi:hypothetical protein